MLVELEDYLDNLNEKIKNIKIMDKPSDLDENLYYQDIRLGVDIKTVERLYSDPTYWNYPNKNIENIIVDDKYYKVWFETRYASDPSDCTVFNYVYYIEEIKPIKMEVIKYIKNFLNKIS